MSFRASTARVRLLLLSLAAPALAVGCSDTAAPLVLTTLTVVVPSASITVGQAVTATVSSLDQHGKPIAIGAVTWSSSAGAVASVSVAGLVTGLSEGTADITADAGGVRGKVTVTIGPAPVASIALSSTAIAMFRGATHQMTATTRSATGAVLTGRPVTFASSNIGLATVDATGLITAVAAGTPTITVTSEGKTAQAAVTITVAPIAGVDATSSYAIAQANARAALFNWRTTPDNSKMQTARAVADLDNDGVPDAVVAPGVFLSQAGDPMRFYKGAAAGGGAVSLTDRTSTWVSGAVPALVHARKTIFGDYNRDGIKDVFVCAHGYDAAPFPGTTNALLLSSEGTWTVSLQAWTGNVGFHHGCASADIDNDGDDDILVLDSKGISYFLINDGTGAFTQSRAGLPSSLDRTTPVFSVEMLDIDQDGYVDILSAGAEAYHPTRIYWGDGTGSFPESRSVLVPAVTGWMNPLAFAIGDIDGDGGREILVTRTKGEHTDADFYKGFYVQVLRLNGRALTDVTGSAAASTNASAASVLIDYQNDPTWIEWVWLSDHDGDGKPDLVASSEWNGNYWARNTGGAFGPWVKLP